MYSVYVRATYICVNLQPLISRLLIAGTQSQGEHYKRMKRAFPDETEELHTSNANRGMDYSLAVYENV